MEKTSVSPEGLEEATRTSYEKLKKSGVTPRLVEALEKLQRMRYPSVAQILKSNEYYYEAAVVEELINAYKANKES